MQDRSSLPLYFPDERLFERIINGLSDPVQQRLKTFFDLVQADPDDPGLLAVCVIHQSNNPRERFLAYYLIDNYVVYWRVKRKKVRWHDLLSLRPLQPLRIDILDIKQI